MAIGPVVTGGLGNGTLTTTIPLVLLRGLVSGVVSEPDTPGIEVHQPNTLIHSQQTNSKLQFQDHGGEW